MSELKTYERYAEFEKFSSNRLIALKDPTM